jgi:hypothetical protein
MNSITKDINRICKDLQGGIDKVYLFPYVKYSRSQITTVEQTVTVFPASILFDWVGINPTFNETTSIVGGDVAWSQSLSFEIPKMYATQEVFKLAEQYYRAIYIDKIGNIRILGLYNGLDSQITQESGSDKASLNGYKVTMTGKEDNQAYYLDNLNGFFEGVFHNTGNIVTNKTTKVATEYAYGGASTGYNQCTLVYGMDASVNLGSNGDITWQGQTLYKAPGDSWIALGTQMYNHYAVPFTNPDTGQNTSYSSLINIVSGGIPTPPNQWNLGGYYQPHDNWYWIQLDENGIVVNATLYNSTACF